MMGEDFNAQLKDCLANRNNANGIMLLQTARILGMDKLKQNKATYERPGD